LGSFGHNNAENCSFGQLWAVMGAFGQFSALGALKISILGGGYPMPFYQ
jgi:hypothetical protein